MTKASALDTTSLVIIALTIATKLSSASINAAPPMQQLRGKKTQRNQSHRVLPKSIKHTQGSYDHSLYLGCLSYTTEELGEYWSFNSNPASCSYIRPHDSSGGNNENWEDDDGTKVEYDSVNVDETSQAGVVESVYDCNGSEKEGTDFADVGTLYDEVVVTNEDVINGTDYDVYEDFNISQCGTYTNLWMWDLAMTCKDSRSLLECNCTFAEQLLSADLLDCMDVSLCPDDCPICGTCLSLIGCNVTGIPNFQLPEQSFGITMNVCILMTILVLLIILLLLYRVRRNQKGVTDDMTRGLIAGEFITGKDHDGTTSTNTNWEPPSGGPKDLFASQTSNSIACLKGDEKGPPNPFNGNIQQDKLEDSINEDVVVVDEVGPPNCLE